MPEIISRLLRDHRNMTCLLRLLEEEMQHYRETGKADTSLLLQAMDYMINYPDLYHHLEENAIFLRLKVAGSQVVSQVDAALREHQDLAALNRRVAAALHNLRQGAALSPSRLDELIGIVIVTTFDHMKREEEILFPLAEKTFDAVTWEEIEAELSKNEDPLFGERVRESYLKLHDRIMRLAVDPSQSL